MAQQELRQAAEAKFSRAAQMLFTRAGYEQSSSEAIAGYRAGRLGRPRSRVADLCCGIGGDLIALAAASDVLAVDRDETHARLALHNAAVYGRADRVTAVVADVRDVPLTGVDAVFIDPARRSGAAGSRPRPATARDRFRAGTSEPPLDWCLALAGQVEAVCIKAAPGIPAELIPPGWEAEFIAEARDLKEAVLWSPSLATARRRPAGAARRPRPRRATVLPRPPPASQAPRPARWSPTPATRYRCASQGSTCSTRTRPSPGPAWSRTWRATCGGDIAKIDPQIAFLTLDRDVRTPFARTLRVLHSAPWHEKQFAQAPARARRGRGRHQAPRPGRRRRPDQAPPEAGRQNPRDHRHHQGQRQALGPHLHRPGVDRPHPDPGP